METQKIVNLLIGSDNQFSKFGTKNGTLLMTKIMDNMAMEMKMVQPLNLKQKSLNQIFVTTYVLVRGNITATGGNADTRVPFKNCASFTRCVTHINDEHVETAENLDIIMPMYNLLEYSDNYADSSGSLYQFKRHEQHMNHGNFADVTTEDSTSFKYKSSFLMMKMEYLKL